MQRKPETAYNIEKWPFGSCNNICFKMTPNGDGAILRRNMWFPLSLKSIRGSIGQHNPKVYMRGFFYCPVQQRRVKAYVTGGIFFSIPLVMGPGCQHRQSAKVLTHKRRGTFKPCPKKFSKGGPSEKHLWGWYMTSPCHECEKLQSLFYSVFYQTICLVVSCHGIIAQLIWITP